MKRTALLAILLLTFTPESFSADIVGRIVLYGGHLLDLHSTEYALKVGNRWETAPFGQTRVERIAVTAISSVSIDIVSTLAEHAGHPRLAFWSRVIGGSIHVPFAIQNYRAGLRERRLWRAQP